LLEHGARFTVVKNTLTRRAAEEAGAEALLALLDGPTAIAFLDSKGDPVAVAKALDDAAKAEVLVIKGGLLDGAEIAADDVQRLADEGRTFVHPYDDPEVKKAMPFADQLRTAIEQAQPRPVSPVYPQISEAIYNNVYAALQGDMSADEAASKMNEEIQKALETF
jgi:ABC-type glycerol-3-phosphate transport system substrate-binding protein